MYVWPSKFRLNYQRALVHGTMHTYADTTRATHAYGNRETETEYNIQLVGNYTAYRYATTAPLRILPATMIFPSTLKSKCADFTREQIARSQEFMLLIRSNVLYVDDTRARGKLKRKTKSLFTMMTRRQPSSTNWIQCAEYTKIISRSSNDQIFVYEYTFHAAVSASSTVFVEHAVLIPKHTLSILHNGTNISASLIVCVCVCVSICKENYFRFILFFTKMFAYIQREFRLNVILARSG